MTADDPGGRARRSSEVIRFLALGDSYTIGEGVAGEERWPEQLAKLLRAEGIAVVELEIIAQTGWTTDELAAAVEKASLAGRYQLVTLLVGVNNQYRGRSAVEYSSEFEQLLRKVIALVGGEAGKVVALSIPDWARTPFGAGRDRARIGREIDAFNAAARAVCGHLGVEFVDVTELSRAAEGDLSMVVADGLHPSAKAYREWANLALPVALRAVARRGRSRESNGVGRVEAVKQGASTRVPQSPTVDATMADRVEREIEEILAKLDTGPAEKKPDEAKKQPVSIASRRKARPPAPAGNQSATSGIRSRFSPATLLFTGAGTMVAGLVLSSVWNALIWLSFGGVVMFLGAFAWSFFRSPRPAQTAAPQGHFWRDRYIEYEPANTGPFERIKRKLRGR